jgi:protein phosphatase 4 regulatory subunit 3
VRRKIHYTYRLQFLKDVVLARALDDSTFNVLNSCILFNQIDIIQYVQLDAHFLRTVVGLYVDEEMLSGGGVQQQQQASTSTSGVGSVGVGPGLKGREGEDGDGDSGGSDYEEDEEEEGDGAREEGGGRATRSGDDSEGGGGSSSSGFDTNVTTPTNGSAITSKKRKRSKQKGKGKPQKARAVENEKDVGINTTIATTTTSGNRRFAFAPPEELTPDGIQLRREVVLLVQQLCMMGKNVQLPVRIALFRALVDRGILFCVQWALDQHDAVDDDDVADTGAGASISAGPAQQHPHTHTQAKVIVSAAGEILTALLDHDLNGVRGHFLKQVVAIDKERAAGKKGAEKAETLLAQMCRVLSASKDLAVQNQVGEALKSLLDQPFEIDAAVGFFFFLFCGVQFAYGFASIYIYIVDR